MIPFDVQQSIRKCTDDFQNTVKDVQKMDETTRFKIKNIKDKLMMKEHPCRNCSIVEEKLNIKIRNDLER